MDYQTDEVSEKLVTIRQRSGQDDRKKAVEQFLNGLTQEMRI